MKHQISPFYFWYISVQSSSNQIELHFSNPEKSLQFRQVEESESDNLFHDCIQGEDENAEDVQMADHLRPMEELLRIPIVGIENVIVVPAVLADEFELKTELLDFVSNNPFFGLENDDPHSHIRRFYQITRTLRLNQVPDDVVKLILFPFSLKGAAETWLENEPPNSITSWDDLVSKFLNRFFPYSKTRELRKEITNFQQVFGETFTEAWERFKDLLRKCPHHGFSLLYQIDFFYNGLSQSDQDSLNTTAGGNLMMRNIQEALTTIENKARVRTCRNKPQVSNSGGSSIQSDAITALTKQVEDLISSMQEAFNRNQEASIQLMQNQMGQMEETFQERPSYEEVEPETITEVVEIASSKSTPLVPPPETPPLIEIVDSLCDKFPIENNSLSGNPTPSSNFVVESPSPSPIPYEDSDSLVEETDTLLSHFDDYVPDYETFCFDIEEKSSSSTTTHYDFSLPEYDSFIFDLLIDPFPPADRSDSQHEEFTDELAHIISPPEYDLFYFNIEPDLGELTKLFEENASKDSTKELTSPDLNDFPLLLSDCDSTFSEEFYEIDLLVSFPSRDIDKVFDPGIFIIKRVQSKRFHIFQLDDFPTISFVSDSLLLTDPSEIDTFLSFPSGNEDKVYDPGILLNIGIFSFTRKSSHLLSDNFMIDKCHILREISLMTESSVSFLPHDKRNSGRSC
ncbi:reverse transcriptase domain-containing protein [Tanacetum coccineum]